MSDFNNVSIVREANIYFDGHVTSRTLICEDGARKSLGVMLPGDYEFNTDDKEIVEIISGDLDVLLPNKDWQSIKGGERFEVPAKSKFSLKVNKITDYCCSYLK